MGAFANASGILLPWPPLERLHGYSVHSAD